MPTNEQIRLLADIKQTQANAVRFASESLSAVNKKYKNRLITVDDTVLDNLVQAAHAATIQASKLDGDIDDKQYVKNAIIEANRANLLWKQVIERCDNIIATNDASFHRGTTDLVTRCQNVATAAEWALEAVSTVIEQYNALADLNALPDLDNFENDDSDIDDFDIDDSDDDDLENLEHDDPGQDDIDLAELIDYKEFDEIKPANSHGAAVKAATIGTADDPIAVNKTAVNSNPLPIMEAQDAVKTYHIDTDSAPEVEDENAAIKRDIALSIDKASVIGDNCHPELLKFLTGDSLSINQQKAILADALFIPLLMQSKNLDKDFKRAFKLEFSSITNSQLLRAEHERSKLISGIYNAEIARIIAGIAPPITLTPQIVTTLNQLLIQDPGANITPSAGTVKFDAPNAVTSLKAIADVITSDAAARTNLYQAFGLSNNGLEDENPEPLNKINEQHTHNKHIFDLLRRAEINRQDGPLLKNLLDTLATLNKDAPLSQDNFAKIAATFKQAKSKQDLITKLTAHTLPPDNIDPKTHASFIKRLTTEKYKELKHLLTQYYLLADDKYYQKIIAANTAILDEQKHLRAARIREEQKSRANGQSLRDDLERISQLKELRGLDPELLAGAQSRMRASKFLTEFQLLNNNCQEIAKNLKSQLTIVKEQKAQLPSVETIERFGLSPLNSKISTINDHRKRLETEEQQLEADLLRYIKVQKILNGDSQHRNPFLKQGLLKTLDEAKTGRDVQWRGYEVAYEDFPLDELPKHCRNAAGTIEGRSVPVRPRATTTTVALDVATTSKLYTKATDADGGDSHGHALAAGCFRKYTTGCNDIEKGSFIETQKFNNVKNSHDFKIMMTEFPQKQNPPNPQVEFDARIKYAMTVANRVIANLTKAPKPPEYCICLDNANKEETEYVYKALIILGKNNPRIPFDKTAIVVAPNPNGFDPKTAFNWFGDFSDEIVIAGAPAPFNLEKNHIVKDLTKAVNQYTEDRLSNNHKDLNTMMTLKAGRHAHNIFFKEEFKQTMASIKQENTAVAEAKKADKIQALPNLGG